MSIDEINTSSARLKLVQSKIVRIARDCGRTAESISLIAVSKTIPGQNLREILRDGQRKFGENRVQEASEKWPQLRAAFPDVELHLIGPLQTNKVRDALNIFDVVHTIDRMKLAKLMANEIQKSGKQPRLLIQINTGSEPQKAGVLPGEADEFIKTCSGHIGLKISGLMCIPPVSQQASPHFALLSAIAARNGLRDLSMGMSSDYEIAIKMGATHIRVGNAIFGGR